MNLPDSLSRKAVSKTFDLISPVAWEKLFEREDQNGLAKLRVEGDYPGRTYYDTDGLVKWLVRNAHYSPEQMHGKMNGSRSVAGLPTRTHLLAG